MKGFSFTRRPRRIGQERKSRRFTPCFVILLLVALWCVGSFLQHFNSHRFSSPAAVSTDQVDGNADKKITALPSVHSNREVESEKVWSEPEMFEKSPLHQGNIILGDLPDKNPIGNEVEELRDGKIEKNGLVESIAGGEAETTLDSMPHGLKKMDTTSDSTSSMTLVNLGSEPRPESNSSKINTFGEDAEEEKEDEEDSKNPEDVGGGAEEEETKPVELKMKPVEGIPGSNLTKDDVSMMRAIMRCFSNEGKWVFSPKPRNMPWNVVPYGEGTAHPNYGSCDTMFAKEYEGGVFGREANNLKSQPKKWKVRQTLLYKWQQPNAPHCAFKPFKRKDFCQVMRGRNLVLVGDEFSLDFHDVLLNHLVTPIMTYSMSNLDDAWNTQPDQECADHGHELCFNYKGAVPFNMRVVLNPSLSPDDSWLYKLAEWNTSVLILNRGNRYIPTNRLLRELRSTLEALRELYPNLLVIWRSAIGGHPHCEAHWAPLREPMDPRELHFPLHWEKIPEQNEDVRALVEEFGAVYLDIETATSLRPDGHHLRLDETVDCTHYCLPGPPDQWAAALHNAMLLLDGIGLPSPSDNATVTAVRASAAKPDHRGRQVAVQDRLEAARVLQEEEEEEQEEREEENEGKEVREVKGQEEVSARGDRKWVLRTGEESRGGKEEWGEEREDWKGEEEEEEQEKAGKDGAATDVVAEHVVSGGQAGGDEKVGGKEEDEAEDGKVDVVATEEGKKEDSGEKAASSGSGEGEEEGKGERKTEVVGEEVEGVHEKQGGKEGEEGEERGGKDIAVVAETKKAEEEEAQQATAEVKEGDKKGGGESVLGGSGEGGLKGLTAEGEEESKASVAGPNATANGSRGRKSRRRKRRSRRQRRGTISIPGTDIVGQSRVDRLYHSLQCFSSGKWVYNRTIRNLPWDLRLDPIPERPNFQSCDMEHKKNGGIFGSEANAIQRTKRWKVRSSILYQWQTSRRRCRFHQFDKTLFCQLVGGRNLVLVGDQSQLQLRDSLVNHLVGKADETTKADTWYGQGQDPDSLVGRTLCGDVAGAEPFNLKVVQNSLLVSHWPGGGTSQHDWLTVLKKWKTDIIILSRSVGDVPMDQMADCVEKSLQEIRRAFPKLVIIWRNAVQGHPDCQQYTNPLRERLNNITDSKLQLVPTLNEAVEKLLKGVGGVYMDVDSPASLRPDGHLLLEDGKTDCLQYCLPGPTDQWVALLQNILSLLGSPQVASVTA